MDTESKLIELLRLTQELISCLGEPGRTLNVMQRIDQLWEELPESVRQQINRIG